MLWAAVLPGLHSLFESRGDTSCSSKACAVSPRFQRSGRYSEVSNMSRLTQRGSKLIFRSLLTVLCQEQEASRANDHSRFSFFGCVFRQKRQSVEGFHARVCRSAASAPKKLKSLRQAFLLVLVRGVEWPTYARLQVNLSSHVVTATALCTDSYSDAAVLLLTY